MLKHCPQCGKELPLESNFCPYCMTKLAKEEEISNKVPKKFKPRKWLICIGIAAIVIVLVIVLALFRKPAEKKLIAPASASNSTSEVSAPSSAVSETESITSETSNISSTPTKMEYGSYVGKWYDEPSINKSDIETQGGDCLQIVSVNGNQMIFSLMSVTEPPQNRIAKLDNVAGLINGDSVSFAFTDDGWGNAGKGVLKLKDQEIYAQVTITTPNETAQTSLSMQCYFKKIKEDTSSTPVELSLILTNFSDIRGRLGEETEKSYLDKETGYEIHTFGAVQVFVDLNSDNVVQFLIDYTKLNDKDKYCFDDMDGNSTYKKITAKYGTSQNISPTDNGKEAGYIYKQNPEYYIKYIFDKSDKLIKIYCFNIANS